MHGRHYLKTGAHHSSMATGPFAARLTNIGLFYRGIRAKLWLSSSGIMDILIDLYQQGRINDARNSAEEARSAARNAEWQTQELKRKVESLTITCQALWELLSERLDLREDLILQKMQEIDLRDGK